MSIISIWYSYRWDHGTVVKDSRMKHTSWTLSRSPEAVYRSVRAHYHTPWEPISKNISFQPCERKICPFAYSYTVSKQTYRKEKQLFTTLFTWKSDDDHLQMHTLIPFLLLRAAAAGAAGVSCHRELSAKASTLMQVILIFTGINNHLTNCNQMMFNNPFVSQPPAKQTPE